MSTPRVVQQVVLAVLTVNFRALPRLIVHGAQLDDRVQALDRVAQTAPPTSINIGNLDGQAMTAMHAPKAFFQVQVQLRAAGVLLEHSSVVKTVPPAIPVRRVTGSLAPTVLLGNTKAVGYATTARSDSLIIKSSKRHVQTAPPVIIMETTGLRHATRVPLGRTTPEVAGTDRRRTIQTAVSTAPKDSARHKRHKEIATPAQVEPTKPPRVPTAARHVRWGEQVPP